MQRFFILYIYIFNLILFLRSKKPKGDFDTYYVLLKLKGTAGRYPTLKIIITLGWSSEHPLTDLTSMNINRWKIFVQS